MKLMLAISSTNNPSEMSSGHAFGAVQRSHTLHKLFWEKSFGTVLPKILI